MKTKEREYTCYKCFTTQTKSEMLPSVKLKKLSAESSRKLKMCKNCTCRIFVTIN